MSVTFRWSGALALVLAALGSQVFGQGSNGNGNGSRQPAVMPGGAAVGFGGGVGVLGGNTMPGISPVVNPAAGVNPYALSTVPSFNPYSIPTGSLSSGQYGGGSYGISTYPGGSGYLPYGTVLPGGLGGDLFGYGYALQGFASTITATGQYSKDIQIARMYREQSRQMALDTARRAIQFQNWYENQALLSNSRLRDAEMALELDRARKDPPDSEIFSGRALNTLLRSVNTVTSISRLNRGPTVPVDEVVVKHINLSGGTSPGNIGMLKDAYKEDWKPEWPEVLLGDNLEEARATLTASLRSAVNTLRNRDDLSRAKKNDIKLAYEALLKALNEADNELTPSQSIDARSFMNRLSSAIKALNDPKALNYFNNTWNAKGKNVAELIDHMNREGLKFAPSAPGDEAAYRAIYQALRSFEVGLQVAQQR